MNDTPAKKPITRDDIEIQLACMNMADIKFAATDIILTSAIGIPFSFLMYFLNLHTDKGPLFHIFSVLLPLVPIMIVLCRNYEVFIDRICLKRGAFDVISSSIYCKDETHTQHSVHYYFFSKAIRHMKSTIPLISLPLQVIRISLSSTGQQGRASSCFTPPNYTIIRPCNFRKPSYILI